MPRESIASKRERATEAVRRINTLYPEDMCHLTHRNPFELTIAVSLSAQTTDAQVNKVTPALFAKYPDIPSMAEARLSDVEHLLSSLGFYRNKAKNCIACAQMLLSEYGGEVPPVMEELIKLPGVGRKTANIVLNVGFGIVEGIAVDTHVFRIAHRLKLSSAKDPSNVEKDLLKLIPKDLWKIVNHQWVQFGRDFCDAKNPHCEQCPLNDICPSAFKCVTSTKKKKATRTTTKIKKAAAKSPAATS